MPTGARASALALAATLLSLTGCGGGSGPSDRNHAISEAAAAYESFKAGGKSLADGPCVAEQLPGLPDWVADTVHNPRTPIDNLPQNQCRRYVSGQAHHFVELDLNGRLTRTQ